MLRKGPVFSWNTEVEQAFTTLKMCMAYKYVLIVPYFDRPFNLYVDVSEAAVDIVIETDEDNSLHAISYMSKKSSLIQQCNYNTNMKEY